MRQSRPEWLKIKTQVNQRMAEVEELLKSLSLHTICDEANCPNRIECYNRKTATFMILGKFCTRNCTFCNVEKNAPQMVDMNEPLHIAKAVNELDLKHVVITSVTRDDLPDGGAAHFARTICEISKLDGKPMVEVLIPDFSGSKEALRKVITARPEIINHNVETVPRLYFNVRPMAIYARSLKLLRNVKTMSGMIYTKSGIMLGLGEKKEEVLQVLKDLRAVDCDFVTIGQYLAPSKNHHPVIEYVHTDVFAEYERICYEMGFKYVASGPLVRSSYQADKAFESGLTVQNN